jgi:hypothetical protein
MGNGFGAAPESHFLAKIITALTADTALAAGDANFKGNSVANGKTRDLGANGHDSARGFMAE